MHTIIPFTTYKAIDFIPIIHVNRDKWLEVHFFEISIHATALLPQAKKKKKKKKKKWFLSFLKSWPCMFSFESSIYGSTLVQSKMWEKVNFTKQLVLSSVFNTIYSDKLKQNKKKKKKKQQKNRYQTTQNTALSLIIWKISFYAKYEYFTIYTVFHTDIYIHGSVNDFKQLRQKKKKKRYSRLSLSRIPRDSLKDIRTSTYQSWESEENNKLNNHI